MALNLNATSRFKKTIRMAPEKFPAPKNVREAFAVKEIYKNGIFLIDDEKTPYLYDRCYLFTDINYCNRDDSERVHTLENIQRLLNSLREDFKVTVANEYFDVKAFIDRIYSNVNADKYPDIDVGMKQWIAQKLSESEMYDVNKVMYLTITCRADSYKAAKAHFLDLDIELSQMFLGIGSFITPLPAKERLKSIRRLFWHNREEFDIDTEKNRDPMLDVIPMDIQAGESNFMILNGDDYASVLVAAGVDASLSETKTIYPLLQVDYPSIVTIDYAPVDRALLKAMLRNAHTNIDRSIAQEEDARKQSGHFSLGPSYGKSRKQEEIEGYSDQVDDNDETCLQVGILVVVTAKSEEELARRVEAMQRTGREAGIMLETYNYVQLKAFNTALPIGCRLVKHMRSFLSSAATALHPFHAQDLIEEGGQLYGLNRTTNHLVFANRKKLPSPHGMIVGHTGGGKSYLIKETEVSQVLISTDDDITMIDPQQEMYDICLAFGGEYLDFTPKSNLHINPMEIPESVMNAGRGEKERFVSDVLEWANSFLAAVMEGINYTQEYKSIVGQAVRYIYEDVLKITDDKKKQLQISPRKQPTLKTLRKRLQQMEKRADHESDKAMIHRLVNSLTEYTEGSYDMFAYPSNVDLSNRFVVFGLSKVPPSAWEPVMITIMFFLTNRMEYNQNIRRATRLIIDETQVVTANPASAQILLKAVITYRKFGGIVTMALQNLTRTLENPDLRDMFSNCGYKCFLDQGGVDAHALAEIQELSTKEFSFLSEDVRGKGVMIWGKKVILLDCTMDKDNVLYSKFTTDFHEQAEAIEQIDVSRIDEGNEYEPDLSNSFDAEEDEISAQLAEEVADIYDSQPAVTQMADDMDGNNLFETRTEGEPEDDKNTTGEYEAEIEKEISEDEDSETETEITEEMYVKIHTMAKMIPISSQDVSSILHISDESAARVLQSLTRDSWLKEMERGGKLYYASA